MARISLRQLLTMRPSAVTAYFNINNKKQGLAIMEAAAAVNAPVIIQASRGTRSYSNDVMLSKMIETLEQMYPQIPLCLRQDHGNGHSTCAQMIRGLSKKAGVAICPAIPEGFIEQVLGRLDLIPVMTVNPGFGGQTFTHSQLNKMRRIRPMIGERHIRLEMDGDVNPQTAALAAAGADVLVAGSTVFNGAMREAYRSNIAAIPSNANAVVGT